MSLFSLELGVAVEVLDLLEEELLSFVSLEFEGGCEDLVFCTECNR